MGEQSQIQPPRSGRSWRNQALFLVKLIVAGGVIAWLFRSGRLDFSSLSHIRHAKHLVCGAVMLLLSMLLPVWRWQWLMRIQELRVGFPMAMRLTWLGYFAGLFLPGAAGGDLAKAYAACRNQPSAKTRAVSTVLLDRLIGLHSMAFLGSLAGTWMLASRPPSEVAAVAWMPIFLLACLTAGAFLLLWSRSSGPVPRLLPGRFRKAFGDSFALYRSEWRLVWWIWLYSGVCNLTAIGAYYFAALTIGQDLGVMQVLTVIPLVILANSLPITPGGLGVGESAGSGLFSHFGLEQGAMVVLMVRLGLYCLSLLGVLAFFGRLGRPAQFEAGLAIQQDDSVDLGGGSGR